MMTGPSNLEAKYFDVNRQTWALNIGQMLRDPTLLRDVITLTTSGPPERQELLSIQALKTLFSVTKLVNMQNFLKQHPDITLFNAAGNSTSFLREDLGYGITRRTDPLSAVPISFLKDNNQVVVVGVPDHQGRFNNGATGWNPAALPFSSSRVILAQPTTRSVTDLVYNPETKKLEGSVDLNGNGQFTTPVSVQQVTDDQFNVTVGEIKRVVLGHNINDVIQHIQHQYKGRDNSTSTATAQTTAKAAIAACGPQDDIVLSTFQDHNNGR